ncbi:MAG TPA: ABC transporter substrate-binding protein [Thermoanaerobaculia bacterium]|nr:ABC transporter substrate-binding protein [Thermoanaerobaculia bacterium]
MITRRTFLRSILGAGALAAGAGRLHAAPEPRLIRVGLILPKDGAFAESLRRGAELGAQEAGRTAELLRARFELLTATAGDPQEASREATRLIEQSNVMALVGGVEAAIRAALGEVADRHQVLLITTGSPSEAAEAPGRFRFHLAPRRAAGSRGMEWHHSLSRFGAEQLNQRFESSFGKPMDSMAWMGWMAVRIPVELALRHPSATKAELPERLKAMRFDGHKGARLEFDPSHHLRQPLYRVEGDKAVEEVP